MKLILSSLLVVLALAFTVGEANDFFGDFDFDFDFNEDEDGCPLLTALGCSPDESKEACVPWLKFRFNGWTRGPCPLCPVETTQLECDADDDDIVKCGDGLGVGKEPVCICDLTVEGERFCANNGFCIDLDGCDDSADCPEGWGCFIGCCPLGNGCLPPCGVDPAGGAVMGDSVNSGGLTPFGWV